jgi:MinD superfamily P-loop ATPase
VTDTKKNIAIASGKGGTGKTTVAVNLAWVANKAGIPTAYVDCDVEEPNGHIFLSPAIDRTETAFTPVPAVDANLCTACGECSRACERKALACLGEEVLVFPELCNGCGLCTLVCPEGAISEVPREIGVVETGRADGLWFGRGILRVGEAISPPLIRRVKRQAPADRLRVVDAPPGTSCPVVQTLRGSDLVLLVAEPTPFSLNDLKLAVGMVRVLDLPHGLVVNRDGMGTDALERYAEAERLPVLGRIPDDRRIAEAYSRGGLVVEALPEYRPLFKALFDEVRKRTR